MNPEDGFSLQAISSDSDITDQSDPLPKEPSGADTDGLPSRHSEGPPVAPPSALPAPPGYYRIREKGYRGLGVVVCNISFESPLRRRNAAAADTENLSRLFSRMGLQVRTHSDLTGAQIQALLAGYAKGDHSGFDCFFLAVSSHGERGILLGTDGARVSVEGSVLSPFNGARCPSLRGKPKVFFLQACRGGDRDFCVPVPGSETDGGGNGASVETGVGLIERIRSLFPGAAAPEAPLVPTELDFFVGYSTVPGYVSWRNMARGSWFLYALCECYLAYGAEVHLTELMTYVTDYVTRCFSDIDAETKQIAKQVICFESRLSKLLKIAPNRI